MGGLWLLGKRQVHTGGALCVALPRAALPGHPARAQREGARGSHPPALPTLQPPGKELSQQHWKGRQPAASELSGLDSPASGGGGRRRRETQEWFCQGLSCGQHVLQARSAALLQGRLLIPLTR